MTEVDSFSFRLEFLVPFVARRRGGEYTSPSHRKGRARAGKSACVRHQLHGSVLAADRDSVGRARVGKNVRSVTEQERGR